MPSMRYYLLKWNKEESFEIIISDGTYDKIPDDDRWEYHGAVFGSLGGWDSVMNKFITPKILHKPKYEMMFDPTRHSAKNKYEIAQETIQFIFEKFKV